MGYSRQQTRLLERFSPEFRERHIEAPHTGSLVAVDTFFVGTLKGVGKLYLQTAIDCHSRYAWAGLYSSVSGLLAPRLRRLDFLAGAGVRRHAASLLVERSAAQAQGMSSSMREAGQRLTSLVSTSVK
jgi:transposase InsO family protein